MATLTVVGAGVAGASLAREARALGHVVKVLSAGAPEASRAALAILRVAYVDQPNANALVDYAMNAYANAGCELKIGAITGSNRSAQTKRESDWIAVDPTRYLDVGAQLHEPVAEDWRDAETDLTIHAHGSGFEGMKSWGYTWYNPDPRALKESELQVYRFAPYRTLDAVSYRTGCRLGSSSAREREKAQQDAIKLFEMAERKGWIRRKEGWVLLRGVRVKREHLYTLPDTFRGSPSPFPGPTPITFGGFHRNGYSLAPGLARELLYKCGLVGVDVSYPYVPGSLVVNTSG